MCQLCCQNWIMNKWISNCYCEAILTMGHIDNHHSGSHTDRYSFFINLLPFIVLGQHCTLWTRQGRGFHEVGISIIQLPSNIQIPISPFGNSQNSPEKFENYAPNTHLFIVMTVSTEKWDVTSYVEGALYTYKLVTYLFCDNFAQTKPINLKI